MIEYKLVQTNRKTVSIKIKKDTTVEVRAPNNISKAQIDEIVKSRENWIKEHLEKVKKEHDQRKKFNLNFGDYVLIRGNKKQICSTNKNIASYEDNKFLIPEFCNNDQIKEIIINLYKMIAKEHILSRVIHFKEEMNVEPTGFRITSAKTRWGSCSGKNSINFTWKLVMADDEIIDYVVVHELSHIKEHNHSKNFWKEVEKIIPDYNVKKEKLKDLQYKLNTENWE
ncbi:M48 family metallopeptidase [Methanobrevibacter filiformis]|uniref:YgjP-like metallopeptidase domain-containing protein n=1 Tax=Methanobrevibacter filiformis TaxID=55758 RepID=A0A166F6B2_9EURY|nr:SprT family zinc-dependent metalloprotease [Methanobrevibacter filiformis]KZX17359.1 hypothetical protein MBFIL_02010 [Methanobrevibacter filiformis]